MAGDPLGPKDEVKQFFAFDFANCQPPIDLLRPAPADEVGAFEVSKDVGNIRNNSPELLNSK